MAENFFVKIWNKLDGSPGLYFRLLWNALIFRKQVVIVDFQGSLGDLVSFCASLPGLRARHGDCWIVFITAGTYLDLVRSTGLIDAAAAHYGSFHFLARKLCRKGNYYVPTEPPPRTATSPKKSVNPPIHTALHFGQILGVEARMDAVMLNPGEALRGEMNSRLGRLNPDHRPVIVVHTGPTWTVKEWPPSAWDEWSELVHRELRVCVIQIGTEASSSPLHNHAMPRLPHALDLINRLNVMESLSLIEHAQLFVGIDSGPLHLATTLGIPTIGLFGPVTGELRAHPRAPFTCITANVPCLGCHHDPAGELHWRTGCPYDIRCMKGITAEEVFRASREMLEARSAPATVGVALR